MPRKHHTPDERLAAIVPLLEADDDDIRSHARAIRLLVTDGPLTPSDGLLAALNAPTWTPDDVSITRAELLAFLRSLVRQRGTGYVGTTRIGTYHPVNIGAVEIGGIVACTLDGDVRDAAVWQLVMLLGQVGVSQIRPCRAEDCAHLYVKTHKRMFCSRACQNRQFMRQKRENERYKRQQRARTRQRQRATQGRA